MAKDQAKNYPQITNSKDIFGYKTIAICKNYSKMATTLAKI